MSRRLVAAAMAAAMLALAPGACDAVTARAHADVDCVHRGAGHRSAHGGLEDDRWHLAHGERVTCDGDEHDARDERREGDGEREDRDRREHAPHEDRRETPRDEHRGGDDHWHLPGHEGRKHRW